MITLKQIEYFISVAETGKFSQSAVDLHVSQSAITTAVKSLEELMDTQLFVRHQRGASLTFDGHHFLRHSKHIVSSVGEAIRIPSRVNAMETGNIKLAVSFTIAGYSLATYYAGFARSFPNINIEFKEAGRSEIEEGLISGEFDLAMIITSNIINHEDIKFETLIRSKRRLWVNADHSFLGRPSVSLRDVSEQPYIMLTVDEASNTTQKYWNRTPYQPKTIVRTSSVEAVRSMVANGIGVSILSDLVHRPWSLEGLRLETITLVDELPCMDVGLAWAESTEQPRPVKLFCEFITRTVNSNEPYLKHHTGFK